jgi:hypothetical protein
MEAGVMTSTTNREPATIGVNTSSVTTPVVAGSPLAGSIAKLSSIVPRTGKIIRQLDYRLPLGGIMVVCAAIIALSVNMPQHHAVHELQQHVLAQQNIATTATHVAEPTSSTLVDSLPTRTDIPKVLSQIYQQASDSGVEIARGNYELTLMHSGTLARYQFTFPLKSTYPKIRTFIDKTLLTVPSVAIESLRLERKNIGDESVNAELRFTVFVKTPS